jgi:hypothetical protein
MRLGGLLSGDRAVNIKIKQLRDLVVALDRADRNIDAVDAGAYQAAAAAALQLTRDEMGLLPMSDFAGPVNALQNMAENIHFAVNGCFADLDGTGRAPEALVAAKALLGRMHANTAARIQEVTDSLFAQLRTTSTARSASSPTGAELPSSAGHKSNSICATLRGAIPPKSS